MGGVELLLCCDIKICSSNSVFAQPETSLGIIPGFGGTQRLQRAIGISRAKEMIFTGRRIGADEALRIGLVDKVVKIEEIDLETKKIAKAILQNAPIAIRNAKVAINIGSLLNIDEAIELESQYFATLFSTLDQKEGMRAFLEKRGHTLFRNR